MNLLTIAGSGLGEKSMSKTVFDKVINHTRKKYNIDITHTGVVFNKVKRKDLEKELENADLVVFTTSPFHCAIQSGLAQFIFDNLSNGEIKGKKVAGFISSSGLFEKNCESQLKTLLNSCGAHYVSGYSAIEYELLGNHEKPNDIHVRTGNNIDDMSTWFKGVIDSISGKEDNMIDTPTVVVSAVPKDSPFYTKCAEVINKRYSNVEYISLEDYKVIDCTGCKACYTTKVCCMKDDYKKLEEKIEGFDNIIHITNMVAGILNPAYLKFVQRDVHHGLYPYPDNACKKVIRLIDTNGSDVSLVEEYLDSLSSFSRQFSFTLTDENVEKYFVEQDIILEAQKTASAMPNMNGYCKMYTRHFDDLSVGLQNLLKPEYEFFKNHPYAKPLTSANERVRPIYDVEDARMAQMGRLSPLMDFLKDEEEKKRGLFGWKK